jgi:hypothetical protein
MFNKKCDVEIYTDPVRDKIMVEVTLDNSWSRIHLETIEQLVIVYNSIKKYLDDNTEE